MRRANPSPTPTWPDRSSRSGGPVGRCIGCIALSTDPPISTPVRMGGSTLTAADQVSRHAMPLRRRTWSVRRDPCCGDEDKAGMFVAGCVERATRNRRRRPPPVSGPSAPRPTPPDKLTEQARHHVLEVLRARTSTATWPQQGVGPPPRRHLPVLDLDDVSPACLRRTNWESKESRTSRELEYRRRNLQPVN